MSKHDYEIVIVGGGPGGAQAASAAALRGKSVALINAGKLMGYGLEGAYKSKSMYESARAHHAVRYQWDLTADGYSVNFEALNAACSAGADALREVHTRQLTKMGVTLIDGHAVFTSPHEVLVNDQTISGDFFIIATGTRPRVLPSIELDRIHILSSDEVVNLDTAVESMLIIGAGVIGCEFASIFAALGTKVFLVDTKSRIFSHDDEDVSRLLQRSFERFNVEVKPNARAQSIKVVDGKVVTDLGSGDIIVTEKVLLAVGRTPNTDRLGLEHAGVELNDWGYVPTADNMQTNIPHIYSVGDVGLRDNEHDLSLVHVGEAEGRTAVESICGLPSQLSSNYVPFIVFTLPMVAGAGLCERDARARFGDVRVGKWANVRNHRAHTMQSLDGFVKLIVGPEGDDRILGARAVGQGVDTIVGEVSVLIQHELPYTYLLDSSHAHPSLSESLQGAARIIAGTAPKYVDGEEVHVKPQRLPPANASKNEA